MRSVRLLAAQHFQPGLKKDFHLAGGDKTLHLPQPKCAVLDDVVIVVGGFHRIGLGLAGLERQLQGFPFLTRGIGRILFGRAFAGGSALGGSFQAFGFSHGRSTKFVAAFAGVALDQGWKIPYHGDNNVIGDVLALCAFCLNGRAC